MVSGTAVRLTRGVALVTMEVVGQSLSLSDSDLIAAAARRTAVEARNALVPAPPSQSSGFDELRDAPAELSSVRWTAAESLGSDAMTARSRRDTFPAASASQEATLAESAVLRGALAATDALSRARADWSLAAFLPFLLLLAGLSERRA